jgi:hypothetical protein
MAAPAIANFLSQAEACDALGSPFTAAVCRLLPTLLDRNSALGRMVLDWPESAAADALALRVCGALHALARSGQAPDLTAAYPPHRLDLTQLSAALRAAIAEHDAFLTAYLDSPPQTNEVARSAILLGGLLTIAARTDLPLELIEIGSSAGLNLLVEQYRYQLGDGRSWGAADAPLSIDCVWTGQVPDLTAPLRIASRAGCDRNPLDPALPQAVARLLSYVWPDQDVRLARLEAAMANAARAGVKVELSDAADFVERQLAQPQPVGTVRVLLHTVVWQYLPEPVQRRIDAALEKAALQADATRPLAHFGFESDHTGPGGQISLTLWPSGQREVLGRADFHGRWVDWA